jgi:predicted nucleic acid-binding Zn ribbon protein
MQRITEEPLKKCPKCRSKVTKLMSNTSFQLKGSGWYVTDYARAGKSEGKSEAGGTESAAKTESTSKGESSSSGDSKASPSKSADSGKAKAAA